MQIDAMLWRPGGAEPLAAKVLNLGLGGAGIACSAPLHVDERLTVTLLAPSLLDPLVSQARVAWAQPTEGTALVYGGLSFELLEREALLVLFQLIGGMSL